MSFLEFTETFVKANFSAPKKFKVKSKLSFGF